MQKVRIQQHSASQTLKVKVDVIQPVEVLHHLRTDIVFVILIALATEDPLAFLSLPFLTGLPGGISIVPHLSGYITAPGKDLQGRCRQPHLREVSFEV